MKGMFILLKTFRSPVSEKLYSLLNVSNGLVRTKSYSSFLVRVVDDSLME